MITTTLERLQRRVTPLTIPVVLVVCAACSTTPEETALETMRNGVVAAREGDLDRAAELLERAAEERPGFLDPLMFLANVQERRGDLEAARVAYTRALGVDATLTGAGVALALTFVSEGRLGEARQWLELMLQSNPGFEPTVFNLGMLCERSGNRAEAMEWYCVGAVLDDTSSRAVTRLAALSLVAGDTERARELARQALVRNPDDPAAAAIVKTIAAAGPPQR